MKRRGFLQKLGLGALAVPFVARLDVEAQEPEFACERCKDTGLVVRFFWPPSYTPVYRSDGYLPSSSGPEIREVPCPDCSPTPEYTDDLLGRLHRARDEYEVERGCAPGYFVCSNRTRDVLVEEVEGMRRFGAPLERYIPPRVLEVDGMRWMRDSGHIQMAYGIFWVGNELDFFRQGTPWVSHQAHLNAHREFVMKNHLRGHITGVTSG